jgi:arylsulfatase A-like enzyme
MRACEGCLRIAVIEVWLGAWRAEPPPNLVLISLDTTRADRLSVQVYGHDTTPNPRHLTHQGLCFEPGYAPVPTSGPSHAMHFTSLHLLLHGVLNNAEVPCGAHETLAERLAARG